MQKVANGTTPLKIFILHNPALLRRLRKARQEQLSARTRSREEFKRDFTPAPGP
jgi:hypothetical protein